MKTKDLRSSILQFAVEGRLVPQDATEEPASELMARIRDERRRLVAAGKAKAPKGGESVIYRGEEGSWYECRGKGEPKCIDKEIPFDIPESWEWARLGSLCSKIGSGSTPSGGRNSYVDNGPMLIRSQNVHDGGLRLDGVARFDFKIYEGRRSHVEPNDVLLNITGASIGRCAVAPASIGEADVNQHVLILRQVSMSLTGYVHMAIISPVVQRKIISVQVGATKEGLSATKAGALLVPLPPLAEQQRIVAKLDELMPLVGEYGRLEEEHERLYSELPGRLRKSILQFAVEGRLVPQDATEEPASELMARIRDERRRLVAAGKAKAPKGGESVIYRGEEGSWYECRGKGEPKCIDKEIPFDIPESWEWARLGAICVLVRGNGIKRSEITKGGLPCIRYGELYTTYSAAIEEVISHTSEAVYNVSHKLEPNNVLMTLTGENDIDIGKAVTNRTTEVLAYGGDLLGLGSDMMCGSFVAMAINSPYIQKQRTTKATGKIIVHLSVDKVSDFLIAVPPLAEQRSIVAKVDELMPLVVDGTGRETKNGGKTNE